MNLRESLSYLFGVTLISQRVSIFGVRLRVELRQSLKPETDSVRQSYSVDMSLIRTISDGNSESFSPLSPSGLTE